MLLCLAYFASQHACIPDADGLALAFPSLLHCQPRSVRVSELVRHGPSSNVRKRLVGSAIGSGDRAQSLPVNTVPTATRNWVALLLAFPSLATGRRGHRYAYYILTCAALGGLLLSVIVVRADIVHFVYLQPLFFLVLAWLVDGRDIPIRNTNPFAHASTRMSGSRFCCCPCRSCCALRISPAESRLAAESLPAQRTTP